MTDSPAVAPGQPLLGRVLYIEDDAVSAALVQQVLQTLHPQLELRCTATGAEGIALARADRPELILLDMRLPDMVGLEVVRELNREIAARAFRVVLLTADRISPDVIKAVTLGAYEYWSKPLDLVQFDRGLRRALTGQPAELPPHLAEAIQVRRVPA